MKKALLILYLCLGGCSLPLTDNQISEMCLNEFTNLCREQCVNTNVLENVNFLDSIYSSELLIDKCIKFCVNTGCYIDNLLEVSS